MTWKYPGFSVSFFFKQKTASTKGKKINCKGIPLLKNNTGGQIFMYLVGWRAVRKLVPPRWKVDWNLVAGVAGGSQVSRLRAWTLQWLKCLRTREMTPGPWLCETCKLVIKESLGDWNTLNQPRELVLRKSIRTVAWERWGRGLLKCRYLDSSLETLFK